MDNRYKDLSKEELAERLRIADAVLSSNIDEHVQWLLLPENKKDADISPICNYYRGRTAALCLSLDLMRGVEPGTNRKEKMKDFY